MAIKARGGPVVLQRALLSVRGDSQNFPLVGSLVPRGSPFPVASSTVGRAPPSLLREYSVARV